MTFQLPKLPYEVSELEPYVSRQTLEYHHGKHHKAYVDKLNAAIEDTDFAGMELEQIIVHAFKSKDTAVFNNAAQAWNHTFLWNSMTPAGGGKPDGDLRDAIDATFGDLDTFREQFKAKAMAQFGSGWTWLVEMSGKLDIVSTTNAHTPLTEGATPLLTLDVWEHAYYLDYQNQRDKYVDAFLTNLVNWDFAASNFQRRRKAA